MNTKILLGASLFFSGLVYASQPQLNQPPSQISNVQLNKEQQNKDFYILKNNDFEKKLPKQASEWLEIIKHNNQQLNCPQNDLNSTCLFVSSSILEENNGEIILLIKGYSFIKGFISLPEAISQNEKIWFKKIQINGKDAELINKDKLMASVDVGDFELKLTLNKQNSALLETITFENNPLIFINKISNKDFSKINNQIRLIKTIEEVNSETLEKDIHKETKEDLQLNVYRKLTTQIPNYLSTKIKIIYSGKPKDFYLGKVIPDGFDFISAKSTLKVEKREDGFWLKLNSGENNILINAFSLNNLDKIFTKSLITQTENELWSLEQENNIRQVEIQGGQSIDPKQAKVPQEWSNLPAYMISDSVGLITNRRGIEENKKLKINLKRISYYGFNDNKMTNIDYMTINNFGEQFLSKINTEITSENFKINNESQVIVKNGNEIGVVIPKGQFNAETQSVIESTNINVQSFNGETVLENWEINLAPRNKMFAIIGDGVKSHNTWLDHWNLYNIFSVFVIVLAFYKLFGRTTALLSLIGIITFQGQVFSWFLWLSMLFILGLLKVLPDNDSKLAKTVNIGGLILSIFFAVYALSFIKTELQLIINPSLEIISNQLGIINPNNMITHLIFISLIVILIKLYILKEKMEFNIKKTILYFFGGIFILGVFSVFIPRNKNEMFNSVSAPAPAYAPMAAGNVAPGAMLGAVQEQEMADREVDQISKRSFSLDKKSKEFSRQDITRNIIIKQAQIGSGIPNWNNINNKKYYFNINQPINAETKVNILVAPIWLVNIFSIVQIFFILSSLFLFLIGVLYLSKDQKWFNKIPVKLRENKLIQKILLNDLKKGF